MDVRLAPFLWRSVAVRNVPNQFPYDEISTSMIWSCAVKFGERGLATMDHTLIRTVSSDVVAAALCLASPGYPLATASVLGVLCVYVSYRISLARICVWFTIHDAARDVPLFASLRCVLSACWNSSLHPTPTNILYSHLDFLLALPSQYHRFQFIPPQTFISSS